MPTQRKLRSQINISLVNPAGHIVLLFDILLNPGGIRTGYKPTGHIVPIWIQPDHEMAFLPFDGIAVNIALAGVGRMKPVTEKPILVSRGGVLGTTYQQTGMTNSNR